MDKIINGKTVRRNKDHKRMWDVLRKRAGQSAGVAFTGSMAEIREAIKLGNKLS